MNEFVIIFLIGIGLFVLFIFLLFKFGEIEKEKIQWLKQKRFLDGLSKLLEEK